MTGSDRPTDAAPGSGVAADLSELDTPELERYGRHLVIPEVGVDGQRALKGSRVLLVGAGGLGSPLALYLAAAGVGHLGIVEFDRVERSNLQRQLLFGEKDVGRDKLEVAVERLRDVNPHVEVIPHDARLSAENAIEVVEGYDVVADGSDNFATRYLVNDVCAHLGVPDVYGSIYRFEGQVSVFWTERGPCYRCLFAEPPPPGAVPSCAEAGVLGVLPGIVGSLQANEVIKLLLGIGRPLIGRFVVFDALRMSFRELELDKNPRCPVCSGPASEIELVDYDELCGTPVPTVLSEYEEELEVTPVEVAERRAAGEELEIIDVREPRERAICGIEGARLVPLDELSERIDELPRDRDLVVHCHHGIRSLRAVEFLRGRGFDRAVSMAGGIDRWSREVDPEVPRY